MVKQISIDIEITNQMTAEEENNLHNVIAEILYQQGYEVLGSSQEDITEQYK